MLNKKQKYIWIVICLILFGLLGTCYNSLAMNDQKEKEDSKSSPNFSISIDLYGGAIAEELILENRSFVPGIGGTINFKATPIVISLFADRYTKDEFTHGYYGVNGALMISKLGLYFGGGIGKANWSYREDSRTSGMFDLLIGIKRNISERIGLFAEFKFYSNSESEKDTDRFNEWSSSLSNRYSDVPPPPPFLFDNDMVANIGVFIPIYSVH